MCPTFRYGHISQSIQTKHQTIFFLSQQACCIRQAQKRMFMQNQNAKFKILVEEACSVLGSSYKELKDKYKDYPICLIEYIEKEIDDQIIEVRFDNHLLTISLSFDKENNCDGAFLFFDNLDDEDSFLEHLHENADYDFKWSRWTMINCFLKIEPSKHETAFHFYR